MAVWAPSDGFNGWSELASLPSSPAFGVSVDCGNAVGSADAGMARGWGGVAGGEAPVVSTAARGVRGATVTGALVEGLDRVVVSAPGRPVACGGSQITAPASAAKTTTAAATGKTVLILALTSRGVEGR